MRNLFVYTFLILLLGACSGKESVETADMIISGGTIYTAEDDNPTVEAVAVKDNIILYAGSKEEAEQYKGESTEMLDLEGNTMTPGFIEAHGHIMGLGYNELNLDLMYVTSYDELVEKVAEAVDKAEPGQWITGRGWHQSKWDTQPEVMYKGFQTHDKLSEISPDNPVWLRHASGHAGFANAKAMEISGVNPMAKEGMVSIDVEGGEVIVDDNGNPTGIFNERAMGLITRNIPDNTEETDIQALELAIKACQRNGITSFHDAGSGRSSIELFKKFKSEGILGVRLYVMITGRDPELLDEWYETGPEIDSVDHLLTFRSIKLNCDGALGSRGAWLLAEYTDRPGHTGHETLPMEFVTETSEKGLQNGFQVCSHAIGDRANREILDRYQAAFEKYPELASNHRFRIEHAQHLHPDDIPRFGELGVIAAMQAVHMSSDRPWAIDRLGEQRIVEGAYVWRSLYETGAVIINGTDVPVEPITPLASFYASVSRKTLKGQPENGYEPEQKMTRKEALKSYTLDAAYGEFEEKYKGSIKEGKLADFTVFTKDIMTVEEGEILNTEVAMTILDGNIVFQNDSTN